MENQKKLQRDKQNKVIGGVCSGMANYFGIDAALIRLLFVVAFLFFSTGFWIYVILWIVMPAGDIMATSHVIRLTTSCRQMVRWKLTLKTRNQ